MIIKVDKESAAILNQLCDIALRAGGIQNLKTVMTFLSNVEILTETPVESPEPPIIKDPIQHIIKV